MRMLKSPYLLGAMTLIVVVGLVLATQRFRALANSLPLSASAENRPLSRSGSGAQNIQYPFAVQTFAPYWIIGGGYTSTVYVRNRSIHHTLSGTIILYASNGKELKRAAVEIAARGAARVHLDKLFTGPQGAAVSGGLMISFPNRMAAEVSQVIIENRQRGIIYDLKCSSGNRFDAQHALYAPWWLPDAGTDGTVALFNTSDQTMTVSPSVVVNGSELPAPIVTLASRETKTLSLRQLLNEQGARDVNQGSLILRYTGPLHSLQTALLLANKKTGFSLVPDFIGQLEQTAATKTTWWYPAIFFSGERSLGFHSNGKLNAYALLSNGTTASLPVWISAEVNDPSGGPAREIKLPIAPLTPLETRLVNLSNFVNSGLIPRGVSHIALRVWNSGLPSDMALSVFSVEPSGDFVFQAPGIDLPRTAWASSYWDISGGLTAMLDVQNIMSPEVKVQATIYYPTSGNAWGTYTLPLIKIPTNASRVLNLKQILLSKVPDAQGHTIPSGVTWGTFQMHVVGSGFIFGGTETFDPVHGSYGDTAFPPCYYDLDCGGGGGGGGDCDGLCTSCETCETGGGSEFGDPSCPGQCVPNCPDGTDDCCFGPPPPPDTVSFNGTNNFIFAGTDTTVTGFNLMGAQGSPSGGTYSWSATGQSVTFNPNNSKSASTTTLTSPTSSSSTNDTTLTVTYQSGSDQPGTATKQITVQRFAYLTGSSNTITYTGPSQYGYVTTVTYAIYMDPGQQLLQPGYGGLPASENVSLVSSNVSIVPNTGTGATNANSEITDVLQLTAAQPLPSNLRIVENQVISVSTVSVRNNTLTYTSSGVAITNNGPFQ